jgi:hypothetical protein
MDFCGHQDQLYHNATRLKPKDEPAERAKQEIEDDIDHRMKEQSAPEERAEQASLASEDDKGRPSAEQASLASEDDIGKPPEESISRQPR